MKNTLILTLCLCLPLLFCTCKKEKEIESPYISIDSTSISLSGYRNNCIVEVTATRQWSASSLENWITVTPNQYPGNDHKVKARVSINVLENEGVERKGSVIFKLLPSPIMRDEKQEMAILTVIQRQKDSTEKPIEISPISWANLQWVAASEVGAGAQFEAATCVFIDGLTNVYDATDGMGISVDLGYSKDATAPDNGEWIWKAISFNGDWGNNFLFQGRTDALNESGTYTYTFRCRYEDGPYVYAGTDGLYDGITNLLGTFKVLEPKPLDIDYDTLRITWANYQWIDKVAIKAGNKMEAGTCVYIQYLTDREEPGLGADEHITCQIGYGLSDNPENEDWLWEDCWWNGDWGNNWYYQGKTPEITTPAKYYYSFRIRINEQPWVYVGSDGLWNGTSSTLHTFTVK